MTGASPEFVNLNTCSTMSPSFTVPKSYAVSANSILPCGPSAACSESTTSTVSFPLSVDWVALLHATTNDSNVQLHKIDFNLIINFLILYLFYLYGLGALSLLKFYLIYH